MSLAASELIINPDGSIYHLNLRPGELASTVITVGDQDRVPMVSSYFDQIEVKRRHREFVTHTGVVGGKRISVISTGIGPDNIDIVCNEMDALINIDFKTRRLKPQRQSLQIIRVGTSGAIQPDIAVDSFVSGGMGLGFDNLLYFYRDYRQHLDLSFSSAFVAHCGWGEANSTPYAIHASPTLLSLFEESGILKGITTTNVGFYGPQGRVLRLPLADPDLNNKIASFRYREQRITNFEMETAAIYAMAALLGHQALSLNVILANRPLGTFSKDPRAAVDALIRKTLEILTA